MSAEFWIGMVFGCLCGLIGQAVGYLITKDKQS